MHKAIAVLLCLLPLSGVAQKPNARDIQLTVQPDSTGKAIVNWSLTNNSKLAVYVYDFFLWGPGPWTEKDSNHIVLGTAPMKQEASCPNRVAPVLLLVVAPGRTIHGDFVDDGLKPPPKVQVSMRIAVFDDPYTVVAEAKRFANSNCKHSPYDAIVTKGTLMESNSIRLP